MRQERRGGKPIVIDDKDKVKIIALYGPPTFMTMKDLQLRFHSYSAVTIRALLKESGASIDNSAKRSGVYLSNNRKRSV